MSRTIKSISATAITATAAAALFSVFAVVSEMDYLDEKRHEAYYCSMVNSGAWPDYDPSICCEENHHEEQENHQHSRPSGQRNLDRPPM